MDLEDQLPKVQETGINQDRKSTEEENDSYSNIPILNPFSHFLDNFDKFHEFDEYERKSSGTTNGNETSNLRNYILG